MTGTLFIKTIQVWMLGAHFIHKNSYVVIQMTCYHYLHGAMGVHGLMMQDTHNVIVAFDCGPLKLFHSHTC